jgi:putative peptide zinc metalloprotease protein
MNDNLSNSNPGIQPGPQAPPMAGPPADPGAQWLDATLDLRTELRFDTRSYDGDQVVVIEDRVRSKFFQVGATEYKFIAALDGKRTTREIVEYLNTPEIDESVATQICGWLVQSNLVHCGMMDNAKRLGAQAESLRNSKLMGVINPISIKFRLFNPNNLLGKIEPSTRWFFSGWFFIIWCILGVMTLRILYNQWDEMGTATAGILSGNGWIWLMLFWLLLKVVHETAHGVACRRYGGEVPEAGVLLLLFTPMAFVNVTSMWRFSNRWHRIVVAAAGMYIELFISFIALIVWSRSTGLVADIAFNTFIMASLTTILFNANPLMRFDGYFILADLLGVTNLYTKGTKWFGDRIKSAFFGVPQTPNICPASELRQAAIYGTMAFFWKISISISLIIGASVLFKGAGLMIGLVGVGFFFGMPIYQQYKQTLGEQAKHPINRTRVAINCVMLAGLGLAMFTLLRAPATKSAPAIVQFADETIVRASADGFLDGLFVASGEKVSEGQVIARLRNEDLLNEVLELEQKVKESEIQVRIHQQTEDEQALAKVEEEKLIGLKEQLFEKKAQAAGLNVMAPFDGFVFQRGLENSVGNFVKRGDALLNMAERETKEVIVSIDQRDLESLKGNEGQRVRVAIAGLSVFEGKLRRIDTKASTTPTHACLCAQAGGPLAVRPVASDGESDIELLTPRFSAELEVDAEIGGKLFSGQRGRAFFSTTRQSLGSYFFLAASDWLEKKIEIATQTSPF